MIVVINIFKKMNAYLNVQNNIINNKYWINIAQKVVIVVNNMFKCVSKCPYDK